MKSLRELLRESPYQGYLYAYPHKTAYRPLPAPVRLDELWAAEPKDALFLYLHVPFCEMRCGFCNLFTAAKPAAELVRSYLAKFQRHAAIVKDALAGGSFARLAIGGGTPTLLEPDDLATLFDVAESMGVHLHGVPISVETSPETATPEKLRLLRDRGVDRVSIGIQSFVEAEVRGVGRPQTTAQAESALAHIRDSGAPTLNIDLMYGLAEQTEESWLGSLRAALRFRPEELYLYPLYVRPLTGLGRSKRSWDDLRLALYRAGRDYLLAEGYRQISMRMFRRIDAGAEGGPVYRCQDDGMVGVGCGARSYTRGLHYSSAYAVGARGVREILEAYVGRDDHRFAEVDYGFDLDEEDRRRRFVILSLLADGLELAEYQERFGADALVELPELGDLEELGLAMREGAALRLTPEGVERSDTIGPWLQSRRVDELMGSCELR